MKSNELGPVPDMRGKSNTTNRSATSLLGASSSPVVARRAAAGRGRQHRRRIGLAMMAALLVAQILGATPAQAATSIGVAVNSDWRTYSLQAAPYPINFTGAVRNTSAASKRVTVTVTGTSAVLTVKPAVFSQCSKLSSTSWRCTFGLGGRASTRIGIVQDTNSNTAFYSTTVRAKADGESSTAESRWSVTVPTSGIISGANECGPDDGSRWNVRARLTPDWYPPARVGIGVHFGATCNLHDYCYGGANSSGRLVTYTQWSTRSTCDRSMKDGLLQRCRSVRAALAAASPGLRPSCDQTALIYYGFIRQYGQDPFTNGHLKACDRLLAGNVISSSQLTTCRSRARSLATS